MDCDASVELWLYSVLSAIKSSLQVGLASALGVPIPESLKFGSSSSNEPSSQDKKETKGGTPSSQQRKVIFAPDTEAVEKLEHTARSEINLPSSWSLRNPNEIVILALQIELTQKFEKCLDEIQSGDKDSLERMHQHLSAILHSASALLQGASAADRLHEVITSKPLEGVNDEETSDAGDAPESTTTPPDIKIVLSPRQIQKLTNLIFILSAKRDLAVKLSQLAKTTDQNDNKEGEGDISKTFERQAQLKYFWSQSNATCNITMMDYNSEYGFEYQGTASRIVCTPETDRALFWMIQGMSSCAPCLIVGSSVCLDFYVQIHLDIHYMRPNLQYYYMFGSRDGARNFPTGADSSDEGVKIRLPGYYKMPKMTGKIVFTLRWGTSMFQRGTMVPLAFPWRHPCMVNWFFDLVLRNCDERCIIYNKLLSISKS